MKKSAVITLIFSIILIIAGIGLVAAGSAVSAPHAVYHHYGHSFFSYSLSYSSAAAATGTALADFGHLSFDAGLMLMVVFAIIQISSSKDRKAEEKTIKAERASMKKAKEEAVDATVHEADDQDGSNN